jgi:NTP pyrophosphatase (non-canonical NTP hydrolase)
MITTFDEYQVAAERTISGTSASNNALITRIQMIPNASLLLTAAMGLAGEGGEFCDHVKKIFFHDQPLTLERRAKMEKELGDIFWYANCGAKALDKNLVFIADGNIVKLTDRHPEGFDPAYHQK